MHENTRRLRRSLRVLVVLPCMAAAAAACSPGPSANPAPVAARSVPSQAEAGAEAASPGGSAPAASRPDVAAPSGTLASVSCLTGHDCEAVGYHLDRAGDSETLAERWNGEAWLAQHTPDPAGAAGRTLDAVSCGGGRDCEAVGYTIRGRDQRVLLAEAWNGRTWTVQPVPLPPGPNGILNGVSCTSARDCEAVGYYTGISGAFVTLAAVWNGRAWTIQRTPDPVGAQGSFLLSVACAAGNACEAVGNDIDWTGAFSTVAEAWNGRAWTVQATPDPEGRRAGVLWAVSCDTGPACEAVGEYTSRAGTEVPTAERWNGVTWSDQTTPDDLGGGPSLLESVSCITSRACEAVGERTGTTGAQITLAEGWNGATWKQQMTPILRDSEASLLDSVSCPSGDGCETVGTNTNRFEVGRTLGMERIDGIWRVMATPTPR